MNTFNNNKLIGIIHLTDIHFSDETNVLSQKKEILFRALKDDFLSCQSIYIVVSGDIAAKGKFQEYEVARQFFNFLSSQLKHQYPSIIIKFVFVPGNHDCNFDLDTQIRRNIIKDITYELIGEDGSVFDECLKVQHNFWNFYYCFNQFNIPDDRIYYRIIDYIADKTVCFHCFNTAWMSQKDEKVGTLFFPVKHYVDIATNSHFDLNIALLHHPLNWFNPNTADNNKRELQKLLEVTSSMQIIGHEHENEVRQSENMDFLFSKTLSFSGEVLQDQKNRDRSGFQTFLIDLNTNMVKQRRYNLGDDIYKLSSEAEFNLDKKRKRFLTPRESFIQKINEINIPLNFNGSVIKLSDIYVFPDVEKVSSQPDENMDDYIDSQNFINNNDYKRCLFEGDSQIGKSSLLYILFQRFWEKGYYPILINGNDFTSDNIDKLLSNAFKSQYSEDQLDYEKFRQLEKTQKILLIDDLHTVKINKNLINELLKKFFNLFERVFFTIDTAYSLLPEIQSKYNDVCSFIIKPLGYLKSNELLEKYLKLTEHWRTLSEQDALEKTRNTFNQLREVLGNKLLPSYPIFVLSIVQALEYKPFNLNETSYGYCYQSLIHIALSRAGISKDDFDAYMNILTEFAYWLFNCNYEFFNDKDFGTFFLDYQTKFIAPGSFDTIKNKLLISKIIKEEAGYYYFIYKYLFYFLAVLYDLRPIIAITVN